MMNLFKLINFTSIGFKRKIKASERYPQPKDLSSKYFIITGANSGLGYETTKVLLQMQANVIIICRNQAKMDKAMEDFLAIGKGKVYPLCFDLSDVSIVDELAKTITAIHDQIDVLIHNAGVLIHQRIITAQGHETTFALMTLVPYKLSLALSSQIKKQIWVSSGGMYGTGQNLSDIKYEKRKFDGVMAYAESKRNQVDLAQLFASKYPGLQSYSMHPGWVDTPGVQTALPGFRKIVGRLLRDYYQGCDTIIYLAVEDLKEGNGEFWFDRQVVPKSLFKKGPASTPEQREKLWSLLGSL